MHLNLQALNLGCAIRLPETSPLNSFGRCVGITPISRFQLPSPAVLNQAPRLSSEGNVGKGEKGDAAKRSCEKEVRTEMDSGCANPETSVAKTCSRESRPGPPVCQRRGSFGSPVSHTPHPLLVKTSHTATGLHQAHHIACRAHRGRHLHRTSWQHVASFLVIATTHILSETRV